MGCVFVGSWYPSHLGFKGNQRTTCRSRSPHTKMVWENLRLEKDPDSKSRCAEMRGSYARQPCLAASQQSKCVAIGNGQHLLRSHRSLRRIKPLQRSSLLPWHHGTRKDDPAKGVSRGSKFPQTGFEGPHTCSTCAKQPSPRESESP